MTNDSFQSFGMPLADYYSSVCILSSRLISSAVFYFTFGGDFFRFYFVENGFEKISRNGDKVSLWTYALTFSSSEVLDNSVWLTWCNKTSHDVNCKPVIITRPTITCSTVVFSLHARTLLLAKSPCCCLKIKDGFRPPKIRLKTVRIRDGIRMIESPPPSPDHGRLFFSWLFHYLRARHRIVFQPTSLLPSTGWPPVGGCGGEETADTLDY